MISSIIAPWRDIDPLILLFSIFTLATLSIVSSLAIFFESSTFSIEGEESSSLLNRVGVDGPSLQKLKLRLKR